MNGFGLFVYGVGWLALAAAGFYFGRWSTYSMIGWYRSRKINRLRRKDPARMVWLQSFDELYYLVQGNPCAVLRVEFGDGRSLQFVAGYYYLCDDTGTMHSHRSSVRVRFWSFGRPFSSCRDGDIWLAEADGYTLSSNPAAARVYQVLE